MVSNLSNEEYIDKKLRTIYEQMVRAALNERPPELIKFFIDWLENSHGNKMTTENTEIKELENLRKEMAKYKLRYKLQEKIVEQVSSESEKEEETAEEIENYIQERKKIQKEKGFYHRAGVTAESYGTYNIKSEYVQKVIPKSNEQKERISRKILTSILFNNLDLTEIETVINAMDEIKLMEGETIIRQGEEGNCLYFIESGTLECYKVYDKSKPPKFLKKYEAGESFGELALLYSSKRQASVVAKTHCILWSLDRETYNYIIKNSAINRREQYMNFLSSVDIFSSIDLYELSQVCDALKLERFGPNELIIKQYEEGNKFYIVESGEAYAFLINNGEEEEKIVREYKRGGFFGELALIRDEPRAANVKTKTDCRVLSLDRMSFHRLLGPVEEILKRNSENYLKYVK